MKDIQTKYDPSGVREVKITYQYQTRMIKVANSYSCICPGGYQGVHCENDINECQSNPCNNNGTCHDVING